MNQSVLIVDDSLTVRMDLADSFRQAGFDVKPCSTIAEARAALREARPDVCVCDVQLPDGDGVLFVDEIRRSPDGTSIVILMLSAETTPADRLRGLQTGADEYVGKPYDTGYVVARVRELLASRHPAAQRQTTVLVIDDSLTFRETLRSACENVGHHVVTAATGEDGLRVAAAVRPDAIIVDGVLPGIDGTMVIRHIRLDTVLRDVPCLLLTGSDDAHAELRAFDAGADSFVRKQADLDIILAQLSAALRRTTARTIADPRQASALGPKKLLAVDDSPTYLHTLTDALKGEGYDVVRASSGEEALALLAVQTVDCILLDPVMPGLSGHETCERIKRAPVVREIPLIMLTALDDRDAMIRGLAAGADDYISKSSGFDVIRARVRAQIRRKQLEDEQRRVREELLHKELEAAQARAALDLAETRAQLIAQLELQNTELEAFSYSVSHDLRAPLRSIDGFCKLISEDFGASLDPKAQQYLGHIRASARRMAQIVDDLLELSRVSRAELSPSSVDLSVIAQRVADDLRTREPDRDVPIAIHEPLIAHCDERLIQIVLENLMSNAWKFTAKTAAPRIEVGRQHDETGAVYFIRDNGAGFDMAYADKLFRAFQRLHGSRDFPGTGVGLATVHRIIERHGGRIWAEGREGHGAVFFFTVSGAGEAGATGA